MSYISAMSTRDKVLVWERCPETDERIEKWYDAPFYFYVDDPHGKYKTIFGTPVKKLTFKTRNDHREAAQKFERERFTTGIVAWESDVRPEVRVLSNRYYNAKAPKLHVSFYDIEVDYDPNIGFSSIDNPYAPINSISLFHRWNKKSYILAVPPPGQEWTPEGLRAAMHAIEPIPEKHDLDIRLYEDEEQMLLEFLEAIQDTDVLCGYNSELFDHPYICKRIEMHFGEDGLKLMTFPKAPTPFYKEVEVFGRATEKVQMTGRILADYMNLIKKYEPGERESYKLASMEEEKKLGLPKLTFTGTLADLYVDNFALFERYSLRDSEILDGFEDKLGYIEVANMMYHMSTCQFDHVLGTITLAEMSITNDCHHERKLVVPNNRMPEIDRAIQGAFVVETRPGMYDWVANIDLNSLYPTAIRSCNMSPETIVGQFIEEFEAAEMFRDERWEELLTLTFIDDRRETRTVAEWKEYLTARQFAVSGYGVVFDQTKQGIIPSILTGWYASRKKYQGISKAAYAKAVELREQFGSKTAVEGWPQREDAKEQVWWIPFDKIAEHDGLEEEGDYNDRLQYIFKIKLNSLYGATSNVMFRYYDLRVAESTTATGRLIERHQLSKANEAITGVYDYYGDAIFAGDTDSAYFKLMGVDNAEEAVFMADSVAQIVNDSFPEFVRRTFLCNPGYDDLVKSARENVIKRGIWVKKKHYICHVIDSEGKPVDKIKVMGLQIKKTTLPKDKAQIVENLIVRLIKGDSWDAVAADTVRAKDALADADVIALGLPKGVKGVENYTRKWKSEGDSARLPGHVAASIHYNEMLKKYNDKASMPITSGMKIKVFYVKGDHGKFKSIALPTDLEITPKWFLEEFEVDRDAHIERLIDNPFGAIVAAIGRKAPTHQSILVDELLEF